MGLLEAHQVTEKAILELQGTPGSHNKQVRAPSTVEVWSELLNPPPPLIRCLAPQQRPWDSLLTLSPSITSSGPKASRPPAAPQPRMVTLRLGTSQRTGWNVVPFCKARGLRRAQDFLALGPVSPTGTRAGRPKEEGGGLCQQELSAVISSPGPT